MLRCWNCNRFTTVDFERSDPEFDDYVGEGENFDIKVKGCCGLCGEELGEDWEYGYSFSPDHDCPEEGTALYDEQCCDMYSVDSVSLHSSKWDSGTFSCTITTRYLCEICGEKFSHQENAKI